MGFSVVLDVRIVCVLKYFTSVTHHPLTTQSPLTGIVNVGQCCPYIHSHQHLYSSSLALSSVVFCVYSAYSDIWLACCMTLHMFGYIVDGTMAKSRGRWQKTCSIHAKMDFFLYEKVLTTREIIRWVCATREKWSIIGLFIIKTRWLLMKKLILITLIN